ncbi:UNVERIFIED_CONTAM: hypothetical protein Scaly_1793100 [Sesamum calycinum]|uniref:DUF4218 domain-containing protein n=1 Tax=Sesamum calycinum TaxID=2727403 RepID=A0AAW2NZE2_9LAMI
MLPSFALIACGSEDIVQDYFEAPSDPQVLEKPTLAGYVEGNYPQWGNEQHMDWAQRMIFYTVGPSYFASSHEGVPDDNTRSCPVDVGPSSYCYGGSGLTTSIWSTANFVGTVGTNLLEDETHTERSPHMLPLEEGSMCCLSDAKAWKHFDRMYPNFAEELRNVRLGFCTDGFAPHGEQIRDWVINISLAVEMSLSLSDGYGSDHKWTKKASFEISFMDIKGKTKDNMNARRDLKIICNRPELELDECRPNVMPKASALTEVSLLLQSICSSTLDVHKLHELENSVAIILCNLEKIFSPAFLDSMEYLFVHLSYEAHVGGPVQYKWMYSFERFLYELKKKVKKQTPVEASIVEAYIVEKIGMFTSQYFKPDVQSERSIPRKNDECMNINDGF